MANKKMILTEKGVARYRTRMLRAGDPRVMDGPTARFWERMGWATEAPAKRARQVKAEPVIPAVEEVLSAEVVQEEPVLEPVLEPVEESPVTVTVAEKSTQAKPKKAVPRKKAAAKK